jgi:hypothetical protein
MDPRLGAKSVTQACLQSSLVMTAMIEVGE